MNVYEQLYYIVMYIPYLYVGMCKYKTYVCMQSQDILLLLMLYVHFKCQLCDCSIRIIMEVMHSIQYIPYHSFRHQSHPHPLQTDGHVQHLPVMPSSYKSLSATAFICACNKQLVMILY